MSTIITAMAASRMTSEKPRSASRRGSAGGGGVGLGALEHLAHVGARLRVGRDAAVTRHRAFAGVVGGQGLLEVAAVAVEERAQVAGAALHVVGGIERVLHAQRTGGGGHELHE